MKEGIRVGGIAGVAEFRDGGKKIGTMEFRDKGRGGDEIRDRGRGTTGGCGMQKREGGIVRGLGWGKGRTTENREVRRGE